MGYLIIEEDLRYGYDIKEYPRIGLENSFTSGRYIKVQFNEPFIFEIDCTIDDHPGHYFHGAIPVYSKALIDVFWLAVIDNFQIFPVILVNREEKLEWKVYFAFNAIGLIDAADHEQSTSNVLMPGTDYEGMPSLVDYKNLVIDPEKVKGTLMFRELSFPRLLVFDDKVEDYIKKHRPPEGWGIVVNKLKSSAW